MRPFEYIELERLSSAADVVSPTFKLKINKKIPKFEKEEYQIAWLKHLFDTGGVDTVLRLCGKCNRTLLDKEKMCSYCKSKINSIQTCNKLHMYLTNGEQIEEVKLSYANMNNNFFNITKRLCMLFPGEYLDFFINDNCNIVVFPSIYDFPEDEEYKTSMYKSLFLDEDTKKLYILDSAELYVDVNSLYSQLVFQALHVPEKLVYIEVTSENIHYVYHRAKRIKDR